ncbi:CAP domain-containing protein [Ruegeria sp. 2012CJ41-6]|uniref:CAP domain-containing protein n=1 Tax=Ruegeria spongiae TaxID=2942209 RepID=A0ABT0Q2C4_9RHOB|nr:CAP domain-containing protein [Ruegeria spongiae]MCL6283288.1 CAP domain-containing protein [Ruegeria spongiae]
MSNANTVEREMLALINQERTSRGIEPLQLETRLNTSAEDHSTWMLDSDNFSHTGSAGSSAQERMEDAGFEFSGNWRSGENIAWQSERGAPGNSDDVADLHAGLMNSPGHRANILNPDYKYIGIGVEDGDLNGWDAVMVTQNFATTDASVLLDIPAEDTPPVDPETPVAETPSPEDEETDGEDPDVDVTDAEDPETPMPDDSDPVEPETEEPDTDVTDTEAPDTEGPDTDVTETEDPEAEEPGTDVTDNGDPGGCEDVIRAQVTDFLEEVQDFVDQFDWCAPGANDADVADIATGLVGLWLVTEVFDTLFDTPEDPGQTEIVMNTGGAEDDDMMMTPDMNGCMFDFV